MSLTTILQLHKREYHKVVYYNPELEKIFTLNFTKSNTDIEKIDLTNTANFSDYITSLLSKNNSKFGIGGYNEERVLYKRSALFDGDQNRTIHLGMDIWGAVETPVYAPLDGVVHSFACNNNFGDYGATIILQHQLNGIIFHTLYGHLSLADIENIEVGNKIAKGMAFAHFGNENENGNWPPHVHFQIIENMENKKGDYPGVCTLADREKYLHNCPDADLILNINQFINKVY